MSSEMPVSENVLSPERPAEEPLAGEVAVDPATGRPAGRAQALVLLLSSCLAVLGAVLLAPVLPRIEDAFAGTPGVEALTPIALEQHLKLESITRDELLARWSIQLKDLDPEVRRRLLFQGDDECYSTAREVRNQALHGYEPTWKVREGALEARNATATYLRTGTGGRRR